MGRSRFVRPLTKTLPISNDDTLTVKKRLTSGERREIGKRAATLDANGKVRVSPFDIGPVTMATYLVDWSIEDNGEPVVIRGKSLDEVIAILDGLNEEDFSEIREAIEQHDAAMRAERVAEKNGMDGGIKSPAISPSPESCTGDTNGSVN